MWWVSFDGSRYIRTLAGGVWWRLKRYERSYPFDDDAQVPIFDGLRSRKDPRTSWYGRSVERVERAVWAIAAGWELRVGDYAYTIGFDRIRKIVRITNDATADVYDAAVYMGVALMNAGEIDWRATDMAPEDFYAA
jgi:hypothetical protein